ncbi:MAG TPA: hypothetical protein VGL86_28065 [Polyangia bacterium]|jgi:hypothetical protein
MRPSGPLTLTALALGALGCFQTGGHSNAPSSIRPPVIPDDAFVTLKEPLAAHAELCAQDGAHPNFPNDADLLTKVFCQDLVPGGAIPTPQGIGDLVKLLNLQFADPNGDNGAGGNPGFAILSHSSALTARKVTTITPTAFLFTPPPADGSAPKNFAFLAFDPGEQFAEIAVDDPTAGGINFYLVIFQQACNLQPGGCTYNDLLTQKITTGWSNVNVYEMSTALGNTIFDCHVCHDPENTGNAILRMQEIEPPFTHWFSMQTEGGKALFADFHAAHGTSEDYGPIPAAMIDKSDPALMAKFVAQAGFGAQPNPFPSAEIEAELKASAPMQPAVNVPMGKSASWDGIYANAVAGQFIATPYHDVKVTDPDKLMVMSAQYQDYLAGTQAVLPDIRDVFLDDALRDLGFAPKVGLDGRTLLAQMCQECHNSSLDPAVTRDRFLVDTLDQMSRQEKDLAIMRINFDMTTRLIMPPTLYRTVTDAERQAMIAELQK